MKPYSNEVSLFNDITEVEGEGLTNARLLFSRFTTQINKKHKIEKEVLQSQI